MAARILKAEDVGLPAFEVQALDDGPIDVFTLSSHARAREALQFGLAADGPGFNIFVLGADRSGRMTATLEYLKRSVADRPSPDDWLYLNNFKEAHRPRPYALPAGEGKRFKMAMDRLLPQLREALTKAFSGADYEKQLVAQNEAAQEEVNRQIEELRGELKTQGLDLLQTAQGMTIVAIGPDGQPIAGDQLDEAQRGALEAVAKQVNEKLRDLRRYAAQRQMQLAESVEGMNRKVAENAVGGLMEEMSAGFEGYPSIAKWLQAMREDILEDITRFRAPDAGEPPLHSEVPELRYAVNLLVDRTEDEHPNVELEPNPSFESLFGYLEYRQAGGILETDFSMIRPGSLHRANGGILVLRAEALATIPGLWAALKAALRDREIEIGPMARAATLPIAGAPKPVAIPLKVKVVLVGAPQWYYTFFSADPDFQTHFRIKADVDTDMPADACNLSHYAALIDKMAASLGDVTLAEQARSRLLSMAARWTGDRRRLTAQFERIEDSLREAAQLLASPCSGELGLSEVESAIAARRERNARIEDRLHEQIADGAVMIDVSGLVVGQVNALTVRDMGDHAFGTPSRVTARASVGRRGVINLERDVAMGGPIQQKGAMVIQGFLTGRFARKHPLSFNCSITFEQSYGGVEGDSASLAELVAIISDLSGLPVRQDLAITGSVNQRGESQVVGGVHHKVEGFFRSCTDRAPLTGSQGVIIPFANEPNLVLRQAVQDAVAQERFHLWSVETIEEALELFLGRPAGEPDDEGEYPADSIYGLVTRQLEEFDAILRGQRDDDEANGKA